MSRYNNPFVLAFGMTIVFCTNFLSSTGLAAANDTGAKGAQIYCFMRTNGNPHEVSWKSAYAVIKRQSSSIFKTSPRHGAVMIIEAVVESPDKYGDCGSYLGDLFGEKDSRIIKKKPQVQTEKQDRYSY